MTYPLMLLQGGQEYRDAYTAAYGLIYKAALTLAHTNTLARGKVAIVGNQTLRQEVLAAITARLTAGHGQERLACCQSRPRRRHARGQAKTPLPIAKSTPTTHCAAFCAGKSASNAAKCSKAQPRAVK